MATSVTTSLPMWLAGCTYDATGGNDLRNSGITPYFLDSGVLSGGSVIGVYGGVTGGAGLAVSPGTGMTVAVGPGSFVVPNSASPSAGGYVSTLSQQATLTVQTADPSNPRIDLVCANVTDNGNSTSSGEVQIITGTAAASPSAPSAPANSITLAQITVPAAATSIVSGNIADTRPYTVAAGGVLVNSKTLGLGAGYNGLLAFDPASGSFYHLAASGPKQPHVLPWAPQTAILTANTTVPTAGGTLLSVTVTTDGSTDIRITCHISGVSQVSPSNGQVFFAVERDGTQLADTDVMVSSGDVANTSHLGFTFEYCTSSAAGDTPAAGSHTITFYGRNAATNAVTLVAAAGRPAYLRVEPVVL